MSSIWATMKKRRGSSNTNLTGTESGGKTPSGRSSASRDSRDDKGHQRQTSEGNRDEGLSNRVSRLAEQVLPKSGLRSLRLPPALSKGFGTGSLPRHLPSRSSDQAPTDTSQRKPLQLGLRPKRSSSVSPERGESDTKRPKAIMGMSTDRFPTPLKNLLQRPRMGKPPAVERPPIKPSRRPGPVGRSWVKVYDDIIYMDDPSAEEIVPILGYTGFPIAVPDAEPLPVAPTPPPERIKPPQFHLVGGDKGPRRKRTSEDKENISPESQNNLEEERSGVAKPPTATRQGRSREISRYKGKRQKRSGTPIGRYVSGQDGEDDGRDITQEGDDNEEVMEDGYIIPQSLKPPKPPRGNRMNDVVLKPSNVTDEKAMNEFDIDVSLEGRTITPEKEAEPQKPKRGMKIYESITIKMVGDDKGSLKEEAKDTATERSVMDKSLDSGEHPEPRTSPNPSKPKRGIKIYETIEIGFKLDPSKTSPRLVKKREENENEKNKETEEVKRELEVCKHEENKEEEKQKEPITGTTPPKPTRKNKIYATVTSADPTGEHVPLQRSEEPHQKETIREEPMHIEPSPSAVPPVYAKVHKSPKTKDSNDENVPFFMKEESESLPPPVPPKKKRLQTKNVPPTENVYDVLPCRPPRRLKSRPKSCEASPMRPKRHKMLTSYQENGLPSHKPLTGSRDLPENRGVSNFERDKSSTLPLSRSKRRNKGDGTSLKDKDVNDSLTIEQLRQSQSRLLPAPPRRKKLNRSFEDDNSQQLTRTVQMHESENVTNNKLKETSIEPHKKSPSPPPPPPPKRSKTIAHEQEKQLSPPKSHVEENGVSDNFSKSDSVLPDGHENIFTSKTISSRLDGSGAGGDRSVSESKLDADIENNLKKIESSFETLDTVIKSLKKYASHTSLTETDKIVRSDEYDVNLRPTDTYHNKQESTSDVNNENNLRVQKEPELSSHKSSGSGISYDTEISDISVTDSDADTVIYLDKTNSQDSLNLIDSILSSNDSYLTEGKKEINDTVPVSSNFQSGEDDLLDEEEATELRPIEISFVIKSDEPVTLPKPEDCLSKIDDKRDPSSSVVSSEIPLQLKTTEKSEFKLEPSLTEESVGTSDIISTQIPLKLSTTEKTEFKFKPSQDESQSSVSTEIPLKLSITEKTEFKFEPSQDESQPSVSTEIPLKLSITEKTEFKFEPSQDESKPSVNTSELPTVINTNVSQTKLGSFAPCSLEVRKDISDIEKYYHSTDDKNITTINFNYNVFDPKHQVSITDAKQFHTPTQLGLFHPKLLRSEKEEDVDENFFIKKESLQASYVTQETSTAIPSKLSKLTSFDKLQSTHLVPFHFSSLEEKEEIPDNHKQLSYACTSSSKITDAGSTIKPVLTPSELHLFSPSLLTSKQGLTDPSLDSFLRTTKPTTSDLNSYTTETLSSADQHVPLQHTPVSFDSLKSTHLYQFTPKSLEAKKELSETQKIYQLHPISEPSVSYNLDYLSYLKSIPFYDLPPTADIPFSPKLLISEEDLPDSETPKASSPEPEVASSQTLVEPLTVESSTSDLANRLEGIHSQLEAIITNYPTSTSTSHSSLDTAQSDLSNRSSVCLDFPTSCESPLSFSSFRSPTSEFSLCSTPLTFYTADTPSEASFLTDSGTNTPVLSSGSSLKADEDYQDDLEDEEELISTAPEEKPKEF